MNNRQALLSGLQAAAECFRRGDLPAAASACDAVLEQTPRQPEALALRGAIAGAQGDATSARAFFERAHQLRPDNPEIVTNLARACQKGGDPEAAARYLGHCVERYPQFAPAWYTLAITRQGMGDSEGAVRCYERLLRINPEYAEAWANLAGLRERLNQLDEAQTAVDKALALAPKNAMAQLVMAQIAARRGEHAKARRRLESVLSRGRLTPTNEAVARGRLADALDRLEQPVEAFAQYAAANELQAELSRKAPTLGQGQYARRNAQRIHGALDALAASAPAASSATADSPVFLLGFPRSGTTLLDRMLCAHPTIESVEEKPALVDVFGDFIQTPDGLERLPDLSDEQRASYGDAYRKRLSLEVKSNAAVLIDKLPLNTMFLPLIAHLLPNARVIFVVRDPRDVCLSCFMQRFALNVAMANFLDLKTTADYYRSVMDLGLDSLEQLPLRSYKVRYEDLVTDPEPVLRGAVDFLGQDWDPAVLEYRAGLAGQQIDTPSYRQVAQPLYRSSIGRWRSYESQLAPILEPLRPLVERLDYE